MSVRKKIIISVLVVIILIAGIVYTVILPTVNEIREISQAVYLERVDLEKKYLRGQLLRKTIEDFDKIKPEQNKLKSIYIIEGEELRFITEIENIANRNNITQDIKLQAERNQNFRGGTGSLPLELVSSGNFINVMQYLRDIEKLGYYFNISNLEISSAKQNQGVNDPIRINLKGSVYTTTRPEAADEDNG